MIYDDDLEKALLSSLLQHGQEVYHEISSYGVTGDTFGKPQNKLLYECVEEVLERQGHKNIDLPLVVIAAKKFGYEDWIKDPDTQDYIDSLTETAVKVESAVEYSKRLRKLEIANNINKASQQIQEDLTRISGEETIGEIFGIAESQLSKLSGFLTASSEDPVDIAKNAREQLRAIAENPVDQVGLPTGFNTFDQYIGGGLRNHAITVIAARPKCGKSTFCKNVAFNVAKKGIPVLILDTEMETEDQINRLVASVSDVKLNDIEKGKFVNNQEHKLQIRDALQEIEQCSIQHKNIAGMSIENQMAIIRKWIIKEVGLQKDGRAKDCLLVYDYIKMMSDKDLGKIQEHQAIGFLMTALQSCAVKYDIPILTAAQLNRDGIDNETTAAIGASDRIAMYCSSISILKWKTSEELAQENNEFGNQKLIPIISRYGPPVDPGDFINVAFNTDTNKMVEKGTRATSQGDGPRQEPKKQEKAPAEQKFNLDDF